MKKLFAIFFKLIQAGLLLLLVAALIPAAWFAWRASQPMERAEFNGLSYYQFIQWRKQAYLESGEALRKKHPDYQNTDYARCERIRRVSELIAYAPLGEFYTLVGKYPALKIFVSSNDYDIIPEGVTWRNFLPIWWHLFEDNAVWFNAERADSHPVCRYNVADIPTPEEFQIMQQKNQIP